MYIHFIILLCILALSFDVTKVITKNRLKKKRTTRKNPKNKLLKCLEQ